MKFKVEIYDGGILLTKKYIHIIYKNCLKGGTEDGTPNSSYSQAE